MSMNETATSAQQQKQLGAQAAQQTGRTVTALEQTGFTSLSALRNAAAQARSSASQH